MQALVLLAYVLPTVVLSSVGILILVFQRAAFDIVFGVLVLIFSVAVLTGGIVLQGIVRAQARRARLQTDFVAKVSHELRTPLASIRMFVDTLRTGGAADEAEVAVCLDVISAETSRLTKMIERLLSWGRMEAGRRQYGLRPELAATLVAEALSSFEPQLTGSDVTVELEVEDGALAVKADREALVEALLNLLSNALKYGRTGGVIRVVVRRAGGRVLIDVADRGLGIPRNEQRRIFEKFYRGSASVDERIAGSGLGLSMVRHVVHAHRGRVRLRSAPGEGTCFTIDLPALSPKLSAMEVPRT